MTECGQTKLQLPHWMQVSGSHTATRSEMLRFSYAAVPLGYVPSTGNALTGSSSPRPASIMPVTELRAAAGVGVLDRLLDPRDGLVALQHPGEREEARLEHRVRAAGQPRFARDARGVDREHLDAPGQHLLLHGEGQRIPDLLGWVGAVEEERRPVRGPAQHIDRREQAE